MRGSRFGTSSPATSWCAHEDKCVMPTGFGNVGGRGQCQGMSELLGQIERSWAKWSGGSQREVTGKAAGNEPQNTACALGNAD